jgi:hypothetical protein
MNQLTSTFLVTVIHDHLSEKEFKRIMLSIAKVIKGKSQRSVNVRCGDLSISK